MEVLEADLLVVGSGVAGAQATLTARAQGARVLLVTKGQLRSGSTPWAQGGVAAPRDAGDLAAHAADTLRAGRGLCDPAVVDAFVREAQALVDGLRAYGVPFEASLTLEGGHSVPRIRHAADATGHAISAALGAALDAAQGPGLQMREDAFVRALRVNGPRVTGAELLTPAGPLTVWAGGVLLACGGYGGLYPVTTAPPDGTGDGLVLAYRAGAALRDLEFVQFHPTAVLAGHRALLVTEAARGEGAYLLNALGERFMPRYDPLGELAPRDVVARAIAAERDRTGQVFLDLRHLGEGFVRARFPTVAASLKPLGLRLGADLIPVQPAVHYTIGGVQTDAHGRCTVPGLYAAGEVASSGLHGANRLASNSLSEGLVFGARAAVAALAGARTPDAGEALPALAADPGSLPALRETVGRAAGLRRGAARLEAGLLALDTLPPAFPAGETASPAALEAGNLWQLAPLLLRAAHVRQESRGAHARLDFPDLGAPQHSVSRLVQGSDRLDLVPHAAVEAVP